MDNYIVSARKYRPSTFDTVIGQRALTLTLKNAIASRKLASAYLFCGPRGVGKTTCARIFAKTINCLHPTANGEACNECESCKAFNEQRSYNIHELDAASNNSVDDIRALIEQVRIPPQVGKYKVYIIDEVHMLSPAAFNAFLKTLEEPPLHAIFILATTEKHKIIPTILSRCQIYDFNRITVNDTVEHLKYVAEKEGIEAEPEALNVIAQKADGGMRDALSIFDQMVSFSGGHITYKSVVENLNVLDYEYFFRMTDILLDNKVTEAMLLFNDILSKGFEGNIFIAGLADHFRNLLVGRDASTLSLLEVSDTVKARYQQQAQQCKPTYLYRAMRLCNDCGMAYRESKSKRFLVELTLIELAQAAADDDGDHSGRRPTKRLNPIFKAQTQAQPQVTATIAGNAAATTTDNAATTATGNATAAAAGNANSDNASRVNPQAANAQTGSPSVGNPQASGTNVPLPQTTTVRKTPTVNMNRVGFSIKRTQEKLENRNVVAESAQPDLFSSQAAAGETAADQAFDEEALRYQWLRFANELPNEEKSTAQRMKAMTLSKLTDTDVEVAVDNEWVESTMRAIAPRIEQYLRSNLHNRQITLRFKVTQQAEQKRAYSRVEQFQLMVEKNPALQKLKEHFDLELS